MKCPKYIEKVIDQRAYAAARFNHLDRVIADWCEKNDVDTDFIHGYVETIVNPYSAAIAIKKDIENT